MRWGALKYGVKLFNGETQCGLNGLCELVHNSVLFLL